MNPLRQWPYGCNLLYADEGQGVLPLHSCCLESNPYVQANCGTCNPRCEVPFNPGFGEGSALTPESEGLDRALAEIQGLSFTSTGFRTDTGRLPDLVPLVWRDRRTLPPGRAIYAVSLSTLLNPCESGREIRACYPRMDLRRTVHLPENASLLLTGNAKDNLLEWVWLNRAGVLDTIAANRFEYVTTPNYSVYGNKCSLEWAYNLKRAMFFLPLLKQVAPNPILTVSLPSEAIFDRYVDWLIRNPDVNCVALNLQMLRRRSNELQAELDKGAALQERIGRALHYIVAGPSTSTRIEMVHVTLSKVTIVSSFHYNRSP